MKPWSQGWLIAAGAYPGFCSMKRLEVFLLPLDRMLVHRRSLPRNFVRFPQQIAGTHLYTWVERGTVRVKCLAQEHNTLSPARARTRTARSGVERTNHDHEATAPPGCLISKPFNSYKVQRATCTFYIGVSLSVLSKYMYMKPLNQLFIIQDDFPVGYHHKHGQSVNWSVPH